MTYGIEYQWKNEYIWKRGGLYTCKPEAQRVRVCVMTAKFNDANGLNDLAILSDHLGIPLVWNSAANPQTFSLRVMAA